MERAETSALAERIAALERQNVTLRRVVVGTAALLAVVLVVAAGPRRVDELIVGRLRVRVIEVVTQDDAVAMRLSPSGLAVRDRVALGANDERSFLRLTNGKGDTTYVEQGAISVRSGSQHVELKSAGISIRDGDAMRAQLDQRASAGSLRIASERGGSTITGGGSIELRHGDSSSIALGASNAAAGGIFKHGDAELRVGTKSATATVNLYRGATLIGSFTGDTATGRAWLEVADGQAAKRFPSVPPAKPEPNPREPSMRP